MIKKITGLRDTGVISLTKGYNPRQMHQMHQYRTRGRNLILKVVTKFHKLRLFKTIRLFPDYLEVTIAVVVPHGVGKTSPRTSIKC